MQDSLACFADDYRAARSLFLDECQSWGMRHESREHPRQGPDGETLAIDAAFSAEGSRGAAEGDRRLLIFSSALHGIEGRLGSALQVDALRRGLLEAAAKSDWDVLLLHGLNPFGFAHNRRWDEHNVDPNRNFLLPGQSAEGASPVYLRLDSLLNPRGAPGWHDPLTFYLRAAAAVARHGFSNVKQAVAEGQFASPEGLFFGGRTPCWTHTTLAAELPRWLAGRRPVIHLDVHSGLGPWGDCKLLMDYPVRDWQREWLEARYDGGQWEDVDPSGAAYNARGGLGRWCQQTFADHDYLYLCAEFGTYGPLRMLRALRLENQAWHKGRRSGRIVAKMKEQFCPASPRWRIQAANTMWDVLRKAVDEST